MPKSRTVSQIKSALLRPALTSNFEVEIAIPADLQSFVGTEQDNLNISCSEASLPGSSIATMENLNDHTGVTERLAHRKMYDDRIDFTFYVDANKYFPIRFFEKWMRYVTDEDNEADTDRGTGVDKTSPSYHYRMRYPDGTGGYRVDGVKIIKFERDLKQSLTYTFVRAYPIAVNSMPVSYDSSSLLKCTVSMSYIRYYIGDTSGAANETPSVNTSTQKPDVSPSKDAPQPIKKASKVNDSFGGTYGPGSQFVERDSATGAPLTTVDQVIQQGQVGDKVDPALVRQLGT